MKDDSGQRRVVLGDRKRGGNVSRDNVGGRGLQKIKNSTETIVLSRLCMDVECVKGFGGPGL